MIDGIILEWSGEGTPHSWPINQVGLDGILENQSK